MPAKPTWAIYQDVQAYPSTYMNLSFSHSLSLHKEVVLDIGAAFGYLAGQGTYFRTYERSTEDYTGPVVVSHSCFSSWQGQMRRRPV
jgi:hypothetical protein